MLTDEDIVQDATVQIADVLAILVREGSNSVKVSHLITLADDLRDLVEEVR